MLVVVILVNPCLYYSVNWLPTYFAQARGLAPGRQLGWILTLTYLALDLGNIACGAAALWLTRLALFARIRAPDRLSVGHRVRGGVRPGALCQDDVQRGGRLGDGELWPRHLGLHVFDHGAGGL